MLRFIIALKIVIACIVMAVVLPSTGALAEDTDQASAVIGHRYWAKTSHVRLCDSPGPPCVGLGRKRGGYYGPFKITGLVDNGFMYEVQGPEGGTKYIVAALVKRHLLATDPNIAISKAKAECDRKGGVAIGMTANQVLDSCWGKPKKKNITVTANGTHEQWVYGGGYLYLDNGVVTAMQTEDH